MTRESGINFYVLGKEQWRKFVLINIYLFQIPHLRKFLRWFHVHSANLYVVWYYRFRITETVVSVHKDQRRLVFQLPHRRQIVGIVEIFVQCSILFRQVEQLPYHVFECTEKCIVQSLPEVHLICVIDEFVRNV